MNLPGLVSSAASQTILISRWEKGPDVQGHWAGEIQKRCRVGPGSISLFLEPSVPVSSLHFMSPYLSLVPCDTLLCLCAFLLLFTLTSKSGFLSDL